VVLRRCSPAAVAALVCLLLGLAAAQATASGVLSTFRLTPASTQAGANTAVTADLTFDYGPSTTDSVRTMTIRLAPGLIASIANVPETCSPEQLRAVRCPTGSQIGSGTVTTNGNAHDTGLYLMPAPSPADGAGFGTAIVVAGTSYTGVGTLDVVSDAGGQPVGEVKLDVPVVDGEQVGELRATMSSATADARPFTRLPTTCSTATSTASVETARGGTGSGSDSFVPTGCLALGYAPTLASVQAIKEQGDDGVELVASLSQPNAMAESATQALALHWPPSLVPDAAAVAPCLTGTPCTIGTATGTSPLAPPSYLSSGTVTLGGSAQAPTLTVAFPAPIPLSLTGAIDFANRTVTFPTLPDLPLSGLTVDITGPAGAKVLATTCAAGDLVASFTPQSGGATVASSRPIAYRGCSSARPRPPPSPAPRVSIRSRRARVVDRGAGIELACSGGAAGSVCRGTLSLTKRTLVVRRVHGHRRAIHRTIVVARVRYAVQRGQTRTVTLTLTDAGLRLLERSRDQHLRARATATVRGGAAVHRPIALRLAPHA
jgi:hypothetical protein